MANLILTNVCNLSCPFCFATEYHEDEESSDAVRMSMEEYRRLLSFVGSEAVRFCGGEPTVHPEFREMLDLALDQKGRQVFVMSNGVWPAVVRRHIFGLPRRLQKRIGFLFNVLSAEHYRPKQLQQLHETLAGVRPDRVTLGLTIYKTGYDFTHLFELAQRYGFARVRYSVAAPNVTDASSWNIDARRDFPLLAEVVYGLMLNARRLGLHVHSDCGYIPPCMFTEEQLAQMYPPGDEELAEAFSCRGPTDIGPGGESWRCYGLYSTMRAQVEDFSHAGELSDYFERRTASTSFPSLFDCDSCAIRERYHCAGGCYALRSVHGMQQRAESGLVSIGDNPQFHGAVASLVQENVRFVGDGAEESVMLLERDGDWVLLGLSAWERDILVACDGRRTVKDIIAAAQVSGPERLRGPSRSAGRVIRRLFEQGAIELDDSAG